MASVSPDSSVLLPKARLSTWKQWETRYGDPHCVPMRVPKLVKDRLQPDTAKTDRALARLQALTLDAVGPLTWLLELGKKGKLTLEYAMVAAKLALRFIGSSDLPRKENEGHQ